MSIAQELCVRRWILFGVIAAVLSGCTAEVRSPPDASAWVSGVSLKTMMEPTAIAEEFSWTQGRGVFARLEVTPAASPPAQLGGRDVREPRFWPMTLAVYEPGSSWNTEDAVWFSANCYERTLMVVPPHYGDETNVHPSRNDFHSSHPDFRDAPRRGTLNFPKEIEVQPGVIYRWLFLSFPDDVLGDFEYELLAFPTSSGHFLSPELGEPVVLQRGVFHVVPRAD